MPRRPDFSTHRADPRVDAYRDRVGRLFRGQDEVGAVLVQVEAYAEVVGGHLWWRRWGPSQEALRVWTSVDAKFDDAYVTGRAVSDELSAYDEGRFRHYGEDLGVEWLHGEQAAQVRSVAFGG